MIYCQLSSKIISNNVRILLTYNNFFYWHLRKSYYVIQFVPHNLELFSSLFGPNVNESGVKTLIQTMSQYLQIRTKLKPKSAKWYCLISCTFCVILLNWLNYQTFGDANIPTVLFYRRLSIFFAFYTYVGTLFFIFFSKKNFLSISNLTVERRNIWMVLGNIRNWNLLRVWPIIDNMQINFLFLILYDLSNDVFFLLEDTRHGCRFFDAS